MYKSGTFLFFPPSLSPNFCLIFSNDAAKAFYIANGFEQGEMIPDYYKRIEPPHCYVLRKLVGQHRDGEGNEN